MKNNKLITIFALVAFMCFTTAFFTTYPVTRTKGGITIGNHLIPGTRIFKIDSLILMDDGVSYAMFNGGDTLTPYTPLSSQIDGFTVYSRKFLTDTVNVTASTYTMSATNAGQTLRFYNTTYTEVTFPANTLPVGSLVTLEKMPGSGPVRVNPGANAFRFSVLDSCTMNTINQTYQLEFWTTNKARFIGDWRD